MFHGVAMSEAEAAIEAIEKLTVPQGKLAGKRVKLAGYQRQFIEGALAEGVSVACLSIGRGNGKSALTAALAVTHLIGAWDAQPQREIVIAGRTADQASIAFKFALSFFEALPDEEKAKWEQVQVRQHPHFSLTLFAADGPHVLRALSADGKSALGGSATLAILDERAAWRPGKGDEMEAALLTSLGKRQGRMMIISTSAPDDANPFSQWLDNPPSACYVQEHRPPSGLAADDYDSLMIANPGAVAGIGATPEWLVQQAQQAMQRGGAALAAFRNLVRNERVAAEGRDVLVNLDDWLGVEVDILPPREGRVVIGLDLGGSSSMTASAFFWPETGRLEVRGWFPSEPGLLARGHNDHVGGVYEEMRREGTLSLLGKRTVSIREWVAATITHAAGSDIEAVVADRFKRAEVGDALAAENVTARVSWWGQGFRDGAESVRRFQRYVLERRIKAERSILMRAALQNTALTLDEAGNSKLSRAKSTGRIDPVSAAVLAVAEASRMADKAVRAPRAPVWA